MVLLLTNRALEMVLFHDPDDDAPADQFAGRFVVEHRLPRKTDAVDEHTRTVAKQPGFHYGRA